MPTVTWAQPSFAGGELAPSLAARIDHEKYHVGCRTLKNFFVHSHGGVSNRPGTRHVATALDAGSILIPFQFSSTDTYVLELGNLTMRVLKNGALVESSPGVSYTVATPYTLAQAAGVKFTQSSDTIFFTHPNVRPYTLVRVSDTSWTWTQMTFTPTFDPPVGLTVTPSFSPVNTLQYKIYPATLSGSDYALGTVSNVLYVAVPSPLSGSVALQWTTSAGADYYVIYKSTNGGAFSPVAVTGTNSYSDNGSTSTFTTTSGGPAAAPKLNSALYVGSSSRTYDYRVTLEVNGEESLPLGVVTTSVTYPWPQATRVQISWTNPTIPGSDTSSSYLVNIYKSDRGQYGWIGAVDVRAGGSTFFDDNITPDTTRSYPGTPLSDFTASGSMPGSVGIYEQRLWFGRSDSQPQTVWGSATGVLKNFYSRAQAVASDAVAATLATSQLNDIRHIVPMDRLVLLTGTAEWVLDSGNNSDAISPTSLRARVQGYRGASDVRPLVIGNNLLFVQRNGSIVRDLGYKFESDGYSGNDMTVLANHLLRDDNVKCWCYQQMPHGLVWVVTTNGQLLSFTYLPEHAVWAWARHETDGTPLWVVSVPSADNDEVYFVVQRSTGVFIEKLAERLPGSALNEAFFVDCGKSYTSPGTTVTGLSHLEGKTVSVLADGDFLTKVVSGGQITLPRAYTRVHVGLPYVSDLETMNLELKTQTGSAQGKRKCIKEVVVRVENSRALSVGPSLDSLTEAKWRSTEDYDEATRLFSGDKRVTVASSWNVDGRIAVRNASPTPLTVLALFAEVDLGT